MNTKAICLFTALMLGFGMNAQPSEESSQQQTKNKITEAEESVYRNVDVLARYRGGYEVMLKKVEASTKNCKKGKMKSKNNNAEVVAELLINKQGKVEEVNIVKSAVDFCNNDIIKALKQTDQWIPARINNKPVSSYLQITINLQNTYR